MIGVRLGLGLGLPPPPVADDEIDGGESATVAFLNGGDGGEVAAGFASNVNGGGP